MLEIVIKLNLMADYGRRNVALCSNGIGNWNSIMNFISLFAIPINMCVILFARSPPTKVGFNQDLDTIPLEEQSAMTQFLMQREPFWTRTNIVLLAVGVEHMVIGLKIVLAILIPDVPGHVQRSEDRRPEVIQQAQRELEKTKPKGALDIDQIVKQKKITAMESRVQGALRDGIAEQFNEDSALPNFQNTRSIDCGPGNSPTKAMSTAAAKRLAQKMQRHAALKERKDKKEKRFKARNNNFRGEDVDEMEVDLEAQQSRLTAAQTDRIVQD